MTVRQVITAGALHATKREAQRGKNRAAYNDKYTDAIHAGADDIHEPPKRFHGCPYCRKARRLSMLFMIAGVRSSAFMRSGAPSKPESARRNSIPCTS